VGGEKPTRPWRQFFLKKALNIRILPFALNGANV
jgi:hypothetical protein